MAQDIIDLTSDPAVPESPRMSDQFEAQYPLLSVALKYVTLPRLLQVVETVCLASDSYKENVR